jgi:hypothetical protein
VPGAAVAALRSHGVDILTAGEDGYDREPDTTLLERATALGRVLVTHDRDFIGIAAGLQRSGTSFAGIVFAHHARLPLGRLIADLETIATIGELADFRDRLQFLPLP